MFQNKPQHKNKKPGLLALWASPDKAAGRSDLGERTAVMLRIAQQEARIDRVLQRSIQNSGLKVSRNSPMLRPRMH